jgi:hypothetical protein
VQQLLLLLCCCNEPPLQASAHADVNDILRLLPLPAMQTATPGSTILYQYKHNSPRTSKTAAPVAATAAVTAFPFKAAAAAPVTAAAAAATLPVTAAAPAPAITARPAVHAAAPVGCCGWVPIAVAAAALRLHLLTTSLAGPHKLALDGRLKRQLLQGGRHKTNTQLCM